MSIKPQQSSHWYQEDGTPAYGATLREARKELLRPSVTTVMKIISSPGIESWKQNILLDCSIEMTTKKVYQYCLENWDPTFMDIEFDELLTNPLKDDIIREWRKRTSASAKLGSQWHDLVEGHIKGELVKWPLKETGEQLEEFIDGLTFHGIEESFCENTYGYGGRVDAYGVWNGPDGEGDEVPFVLDWKTQGKQVNSIRFYSDWAIQLSANAFGLQYPDAILISPALSVEPPGGLRVKVWSLEDNEHYFQRFLNRLAVWKDEKNYDPITD